jgi:hypothetical protein
MIMEWGRFLFSLVSAVLATAAAALVIFIGLKEPKDIGFVLYLMSGAILFSVYSVGEKLKEFQ